ncbi:MAG: aminotransferase class V-fold PLP-dependent enzyme [Bacteroidetes bacterium]|nr:MAG: aminotransferase class V-fold PLP-dependent enzyme [Bacteroidota bacterium]
MPDKQKWRDETPGCARYNHLNSAGSSLPPKPVIAAVQNYFYIESLTGGYETAAARADEIRGFYTSLADMLGCQPRNIAHASSATEAFSKALSSVPFRAGDVILTTDYDYVSNQIAFLFLVKTAGVRLIRAQNTSHGGVDVDSVRDLIKKHHPRLVAVTHVPTNSGLVQPVEAIGELCRENDVLYLVDACQSAGQMPLQVEKIQCDFLSATFRKFMRGPRGTGFLYVADSILERGFEPVFPDHIGAHWKDDNVYIPAPDASRFEYWEKPYALLVGAKAATEYALETGLEVIQKEVRHLATYTRQKLSKIDGVRVLDEGRALCGIVTAHHPQWNLSALHAFLLKKNIHVSMAPQAAALIDFKRKGVDGALRVSPHYFNTEAEIDALTDALIEYGR